MDTGQAAAFGAGAAAGAAAFYLCHRALSSQQCVSSLPAPLGQAAVCEHRGVAAGRPDGARASVARFEEDEVLREHLTRNVQFFGLEGQRRIAGAFVVVVGLGGVGSHAAHLLLRSGVGRLRLVDFDLVSLSSLNRHCLATRADVGVPKAACLARHFAEIMPEADVEALCHMYTPETEDLILEGSPDYVIDAIDNIDTKVALLAACKARGLPVLCSAGAGAKADPTRLRVVDVAESAVDPLARAVRHRLRRDHGIVDGVPVLLSTERPRCGLVFAPEEEAPGANPLDYQVVPNFRIRTIPVLGTTPAAFGLAAAAHVLCELAGAPIVSQPAFRVQPKAMRTQYDRLEARESDHFGGSEGLQVDHEEVEVVVRELWRGTSARWAFRRFLSSSKNGGDGGVQKDEDAGLKEGGPQDLGESRSVGRLALTRWNPALPARIDNLILLTQAEADAHDEEVGAGGGARNGGGGGGGGLAGLKAREPAWCKEVERVLERARREFLHAVF